ncbi:hypothetical protein DFH06DRAFT_1339775 [Mycena polygramma]|nr:hypothetical protein DFH06DRAFT_1339775 [Mycena polygramma]
MAYEPLTWGYKPYPWPFGQPSILDAAAELREQERIQANYWLDADLGEEEQDDDDDSDYIPSEDDSGSEEYTSDSDQDSDTSSAVSDNSYISESELVYVKADEQTAYRPSSPTPSQKDLEDQENLVLQIAELVEAEEAAAAAYNPDEVVSLITQFYELLVTMSHCPEGSLRYAPHKDPPVNEALAVQLGYDPAVVSLMLRLPYFDDNVNQNPEMYGIIGRTAFADYTTAYDLQEGRHPYPYQYLDGCPDIDPWLLPIMLPNRDGWNVMLDTRLGVVRAYSTYTTPSSTTVEWRRHGEVSDEDYDTAQWTEYRRVPLVPAARYFSELIRAYRSLSRLPIIRADANDPKEMRHQYYSDWRRTQEREQQQTLLSLYSECGWPDKWRRAEFVAKWEVQKDEIDARARQAEEIEFEGLPKDSSLW